MVTLLIPPPGYIDPHDWTPLSPGTPALQMPFPSGDTTGLADTSAYTTLVTPLISTGGVLIFQPGRYYINQLKLYSGLEYWGTPQSPLAGGAGTIITAPQGSTLDMVVPSAALISAPGLRYLTFDGGNGSNGAVLVQANQFNCINLNLQVVRPNFRDITIVNVPGDGIVVSVGPGGASFSEIRILNPYGNGVNLQASDFHLHDIEVYVPGLNGFLFQAQTAQGTNLKSNKAGARGLSGVPSSTNGCCGMAFTSTAAGNTISGGDFNQNDIGSFLSPQTYTATNATPCVFTGSGTSFVNGTPVVLSGGSPPAGFTNGTVYYVVASGVAGAGTFELAATLGGAAIASTSTGNGTATPYNGISVYMAGNRNRVDVSCSGASQSLLYLDGSASYNMIDIQGNNSFNVTSPNYVYVINAGTVRNNRVRIVGNPTVGQAYALLAGGGTEANNNFDVEGESNSAAQSVAFAATVTPDPYLGSYVQIGTLTAAITINNPANGHAGTIMKLRLLQNAAGGNAVTFGANYKVSAAIPTTGLTATEITFICEATGGTWREVSRATA